MNTHHLVTIAIPVGLGLYIAVLILIRYRALKRDKDQLSDVEKRQREFAQAMRANLRILLQPEEQFIGQFIEQLIKLLVLLLGLAIESGAIPDRQAQKEFVLALKANWRELLKPKEQVVGQLIEHLLLAMESGIIPEQPPVWASASAKAKWYQYCRERLEQGHKHLTAVQQLLEMPPPKPEHGNI